MIEEVHNAQDATNIDFAKLVYVYFNFTKKCWSIRQDKVKAHCDYICLRDANFQVSERGRQRTIREQRKNVHAFVVGYIVLKPAEVPYAFSSRWSEVRYNPYTNFTFVTNDGVPVASAEFVDMLASSEISKVIALI